MQRATKLLLLIIALLPFCACHDPGEVQQVTNGEFDGIEVYKYWLDNGQLIYIARQKESTSVMWRERSGKTTIQRCTVTVHEDGSYEIIADSTNQNK